MMLCIFGGSFNPPVLKKILRIDYPSFPYNFFAPLGLVRELINNIADFSYV
jgi:hypothetical protein